MKLATVVLGVVLFALLSMSSYAKEKSRVNQQVRAAGTMHCAGKICTADWPIKPKGDDIHNQTWCTVPDSMGQTDITIRDSDGIVQLVFRQICINFVDQDPSEGQSRILGWSGVADQIRTGHKGDITLQQEFFQRNAPTVDLIPKFTIQEWDRDCGSHQTDLTNQLDLGRNHPRILQNAAPEGLLWFYYYLDEGC